MVVIQGIRVAAQIAKGLYKTGSADIRVLRKAGWSPAAARGISHGLFAGSSVNYLKSGEDNLDDGSLQQGDGASPSSPNQARGRLKRNNNRRYSTSRRNYKKCRCSGSKRKYSRGNRF